METAYNNNEAKKFYQEMNSIRKRFKPQTLLIRHTEGNILSNKEKALQGSLNSMRSILNCKME
jgi:hypothetical protein